MIDASSEIKNTKKIKINFLGDSITEGVGASSPEKCFVSRIAQKTGAICNNYGIGGTRIAKQKNLLEWAEKTDRYFGSRVADMDKDADVVIVFGGTNDQGHGDAPLGKTDSRDENTFCGAMNVLCENLINTFPDSKIVFITPLHRIEEDLLWNSMGVRNVGTLSDYCEIIRNICSVYSIPVFDAYSEMGINPNIEVQKLRYMNDGVHPNDAGHEKLADYIITKLKTI